MARQRGSTQVTKTELCFVFTLLYVLTGAVWFNPHNHLRAFFYR